MTEVSTIGLDLAKNVFQAHGADGAGAVVFRSKLRRDQVLPFFAQAPCLVAMEACPSAHHWGREISKFRTYSEADRARLREALRQAPEERRADAEAIYEAAQRPTMHFVAVKSEAKQASAAVFRTRDVLVGQRTQVINAVRGHMAEYGLIAPQGPSHVERLVAKIEDQASAVPQANSCLLSSPPTLPTRGT